MVKESDFQKEVAGWLRKQGCRVIKQDPTIGKQKGIPDLLVVKEGLWLMLEIKAHKDSDHQPGQDEWVAWANENSYGKFVYPENWGEIQEELEEMLK